MLIMVGELCWQEHEVADRTVLEIRKQGKMNTNIPPLTTFMEPIKPNNEIRPPLFRVFPCKQPNLETSSQACHKV